MGFKIEGRGNPGHRQWAVLDESNTLVCLCCYRRGAMEVVRRLSAQVIEAGQALNVQKAA